MFLFFKLFTDKMGSGLLPNLDGQKTHAPICQILISQSLPYLASGVWSGENEQMKRGGVNRTDLSQRKITLPISGGFEDHMRTKRTS